MLSMLGMKRLSRHQLGVTRLTSMRLAQKGAKLVSGFAAERAAVTRSILDMFDPKPPVAEALTAPGSWYTSQPFYDSEKDAIFCTNWIHVGRLDQLSEPGAFFTGEVVGQPFIVSRTKSGEIKAMFNVCAHHAAIVVSESEGVASQFTCPYHGWCYRNDGRLLRCKQMTGIKNFKARDFGLKPIQVDTLGPFIFINFSEEPLPPVREVLFEAVLEPLEDFGRLEKLRFVKRIHYNLDCNWKVFCDNYLDGGYHVPVAHKDLASGLDEDAYTVRQVMNGSIQSVPALGSSRLGTGAVYLFSYPNFMLNRYGPWLDTNTVVPTGLNTSTVTFDYYLDEALVREQDPKVDMDKFVEDSLVASDKVQREDEHLCAIVQRGLSTKGYTAGRYVPSLEHCMYAFHQQIHRDMSRVVQ